MRIAISKAENQLDELVLRAWRGGEVILTRHGRPVVKLVAEKTEPIVKKMAAISRKRSAL